MTLATLLAAGPGDPAQLLVDGALLPRDTFRSLGAADHVLREAEAAAARLRARTEAALDALRHEAQRQGVAQGHALAVAAVLGTLDVERRMRELLAQRLAAIVERCVRALLGELGPDEVLRRQVLQLLQSAGLSPGEVDADGVRLRVHPRQWAQVRAAAAERVAGIEVVADASRAPDALLLELRLGFVESSLELTLRELNDLVQQALAHALHLQGGPGDGT